MRVKLNRQFWQEVVAPEMGNQMAMSSSQIHIAVTIIEYDVTTNSVVVDIDSNINEWSFLHEVIEAILADDKYRHCENLTQAQAVFMASKNNYI